METISQDLIFIGLIIWVRLGIGEIEPLLHDIQTINVDLLGVEVRAAKLHMKLQILLLAIASDKVGCHLCQTY